MVVMIEYDMWFVVQVDWVIDVGFGVGSVGGIIVVVGVLYQVVCVKGSSMVLFLVRELVFVQS